MFDKTYLTTGRIASLLGVPEWIVRRAVDSLGEEIPRAGLYRLIPQSLLGRLRAVIERQSKKKNRADG